MMNFPSYSNATIAVRRPKDHEAGSAKALVQTVVDEIYGALEPQVVDDEDWLLSWVAVSDDQIIGLVLTHEDWITDLWVRAAYRGHGVGRKLLLQGECEIAARGYQTLRLRVVQSNTRAVAFYQRNGWQIEREFHHESLPTFMFEMTKPVLPLASRTPRP